MIKISKPTQAAISQHTGSQSQLRTSPRKTHNAIKSAEERQMGVRVNATPEHAAKAILASARGTLHRALNKGTGKLARVMDVEPESPHLKAWEACTPTNCPMHLTNTGWEKFHNPECPVVNIFTPTSPEWNRSKEPKPNTGRRVGVWKD